MTLPTDETRRLLLARFPIPSGAEWEPLPGGHINRSWKVHGHGPPLLVQRLNPEVFPDGALVLRNLARVSAHLQQAAARLALPEPGVPRLVLTRDAEPGVLGPDRAWWRVLRFIEGGVAADQPRDLRQVEEIARAFGLFHRRLADFPDPPLEQPIPGFHDSAARYAALLGAATADAARRRDTVAAELSFATARASLATVLPPLLESGALPRRVVHNDAKGGNALLDAASGRALAVVDLDTVMPGTLLYDTGDLIRSLAAAAAEDEPDPSRVRVEPGRVLAVLRGFLRGADPVVLPAERALLVFSGILLAWEQGVRFLTDYLEGDRYYRCVRQHQNLDRCRVQFQLARQLEATRSALEDALAGAAG